MQKAIIFVVLVVTISALHYNNEDQTHLIDTHLLTDIILEHDQYS